MICKHGLLVVNDVVEELVLRLHTKREIFTRLKTLSPNKKNIESQHSPGDRNQRDRAKRRSHTEPESFLVALE